MIFFTQHQMKCNVDRFLDSFTMLRISPCCIPWFLKLHACTTYTTTALRIYWMASGIPAKSESRYWRMLYV